jgi:hypothetical protein
VPHFRFLKGSLDGGLDSVLALVLDQEDSSNLCNPLGEALAGGLVRKMTLRVSVNMVTLDYI